MKDATDEINVEGIEIIIACMAVTEIIMALAKALGMVEMKFQEVCNNYHYFEEKEILSSMYSRTYPN